MNKAWNAERKVTDIQNTVNVTTSEDRNAYIIIIVANTNYTVMTFLTMRHSK